MTWWILFAIGWFLAVFWLVGAAPIIRYLRDARLQERAQDLPDPEVWPKVSVVVTAKDEAERIEEALRSVARLDYPVFEVIAVDDRSQDGTSEIVDRVAVDEPRVEAVHVSTLPEDWLGKCHAMHLGAQRSSGELLLFTDGDVVFAPETLRLAVRYFESRPIDHLTLIPGITAGGYWEDAIKSYFAMVFIMGNKAWAAASTSKKHYVGVGAFNLVRRAAYDGIGGHEALRLEVVDDVMLGKRLKEKGYRQEALIASRHLRLAWFEGVGGFIRGLEKNCFAWLGFSLSMVFFFTLLMVLFYAVPYLGILVFRDARILGYAATVVIIHAFYGYVASTYRNGWLIAPALPVIALIYLWTIWRSALVTLRQQGVRWRGTFYPLDVLKRGSTGVIRSRRKEEPVE